MYYTKSETYIDRRFLKDCAYFFCQQIISAVDIESIIPYNLTQRAQETLNL